MTAIPSFTPWKCATLACLAASSAFAQTRLIEWGTTLDPTVQVAAAKSLAKSIANPGASNWQAKGDQKRTYRFPEANASNAYRVCVPTSWDGHSKLALVMFLHGAGNDESSYLDQNSKQMVKLADQHGVVLVSALGCSSAYGTFLKLPAVFGKPAEVAPLLAQRTAATETANELSEKDVLNVLELVKAEYPIDTTNLFLTGHSMGSGGTWYLGGKYAGYWRGLAPMSGPFVTETGYPWDRLVHMPIFITEGTGAATVQSSHDLRDWRMKSGAPIKYKEVNADHPGMVPLVLPDVFDFFDSLRQATAGVSTGKSSPGLPDKNWTAVFASKGASLRIAAPSGSGSERVRLSLVGLSGEVRFSGEAPLVGGQAVLDGRPLPTGLYLVRFEGN